LISPEHKIVTFHEQSIKVWNFNNSGKYYKRDYMVNWLKDAIKNVSSDCVIFGFEDSSLKILLYKRGINPCKGVWALPGGFLKKGELFEEAARRILKATTGVSDIYLEEVAVFDQLDRFQPWRVFTVGYFALVKPGKYKITATGLDSTEVRWFNYDELPELAWDHKNIVETALKKLRSVVLHKPIGLELMPNKFTLPQLQNLYEVILNRPLDRRNFRKKMIQMNLLKKLDERDPNNKTNAAYLYKFDKRVYNKLITKGFVLE
jgi:8-oxo-dGTP diphosphatase